MNDSLNKSQWSLYSGHSLHLHECVDAGNRTCTFFLSNLLEESFSCSWLIIMLSGITVILTKMHQRFTKPSVVEWWFTRHLSPPNLWLDLAWRRNFTHAHRDVSFCSLQNWFPKPASTNALVRIISPNTCIFRGGSRSSCIYRWIYGALVNTFVQIQILLSFVVSLEN